MQDLNFDIILWNESSLNRNSQKRRSGVHKVREVNRDRQTDKLKRIGLYPFRFTRTNTLLYLHIYVSLLTYWSHITYTLPSHILYTDISVHVYIMLKSYCFYVLNSHDLHTDVSLLIFSNKMFSVWSSCTQMYRPYFCFINWRKNDSMFFSRKKLKMIRKWKIYVYVYQRQTSHSLETRLIL